MILVFSAGCFALWATGTSWAYTLDQVRIDWWTGSGAHQVLLVVDFWPGNGDADSFAFGYRFDQAQITGLDLLDGLQAAGRGFSYAAPGGYLTDIWYVKGGVTHHAATDWPASWVSYWTSLDFGETWQESMVGAGDRILHEGDTDGWLAKPGDDWTSVPVTPLLFSPNRGDLNCDGVVDFADIDPFVALLSGG